MDHKFDMDRHRPWIIGICSLAALLYGIYTIIYIIQLTHFRVGSEFSATSLLLVPEVGVQDVTSALFSLYIFMVLQAVLQCVANILGVVGAFTRNPKLLLAYIVLQILGIACFLGVIIGTIVTSVSGSGGGIFWVFMLTFGMQMVFPLALSASLVLIWQSRLIMMNDESVTVQNLPYRNLVIALLSIVMAFALFVLISTFLAAAASAVAVAIPIIMTIILLGASLVGILSVALPTLTHRIRVILFAVFLGLAILYLLFLFSYYTYSLSVSGANGLGIFVSILAWVVQLLIGAGLILAWQARQSLLGGYESINEHANIQHGTSPHYGGAGYTATQGYSAATPGY